MKIKLTKKANGDYPSINTSPQNDQQQTQQQQQPSTPQQKPTQTTTQTGQKQQQQKPPRPNNRSNIAREESSLNETAQSIDLVDDVGVDVIDSPSSPTSLAINPPIIINHKDESSSFAPVPKLTTVVKIVNPGSNQPAAPQITVYEASPAIGVRSAPANNSTLTNVTQIARIHSNGSNSVPQPPQQSNSFSMTSSALSGSSLQVQPQLQRNTSSSSSSMNNSVAVIDVKAAQPRATAAVLHDDGVRYKFVSNQTIGVKSSNHNEFDDINMDSMSDTMNKRNGCGKCLRCCSIM